MNKENVNNEEEQKRIRGNAVAYGAKIQVRVFRSVCSVLVLCWAATMCHVTSWQIITPHTQKQDLGII